MSAATASSTNRPRALLLHGGWEGHDPDRVADYAERHLLGGFEVVRSSDLAVLRADVLSGFDLLVPVWTFGEITEAQEADLLSSVVDGIGVLAWHGAASAFLASRPHKLLLGGQFVTHPGGTGVTYTVRFHRDADALVAGLDDLKLTSEQYYLLIDPAVKVLATTTIEGDSLTWLAGVTMPVAWTRPWGKGRVFYCSLGHSVEVLALPTVSTLLRRAARWASRTSTMTARP